MERTIQFKRKPYEVPEAEGLEMMMEAAILSGEQLTPVEEDEYDDL